MPDVRFTEADAERAFQEWGCNCGPGALAAIMNMTLDEVRPHIPGFASKRYTSPTMMYAALHNIGRPWIDVQRDELWPSHGLVRIQFEGPWMKPGVPIPARYRYTHWIGAQILVGQVGVFDINCINNGNGWVSLEDWTSDIAPHLASAFKRATGEWYITHSIEVRR